MSLYRDVGVVLRVSKLGEADRIVTLLTRRYGKVRAVAKGVRRTGSRFGARLEPFAHVDVQLHTGRTLDVVTQVQTLDAFGVGIVDDYRRYTTACAALETVDRIVAEEREPVLRMYLLTVGALRAFNGRQRDPSLVLDSFVLRAMAFAGWSPALGECARCGLAGPHGTFSVIAGGTVCAECRPAGAVRPAAATVRLLDALLNGDWPTAEAAEEAARGEGSGLVAAHLQWHLEHRLRSLPLVERHEATIDREARQPEPPNPVPELIRQRASALEEESAPVSSSGPANTPGHS
ncbi:DNA repair protein RecO [Actinopolyspora erythraea]|uniref:DNA repair protein RecO n=1 Tax=Actinopolyspora erythraea TaxID=414996 RepID=A0A099D1P0_9ACTN|nr:DNA repair protein RecO [Actinopolyspora erythraea]ASU77975.1 DNA repair protein RecO [Actinopolyspora erythraea]KGI79737.1 DNA recombination protein RecO [Actinopolyspora erythraea]